MSILRQSIAFIVLGMLITAILYCTSEWLAPVYGSYKLRNKKLLQSAKSIEAINLGSSQAKALDYKELKMRGFHLWKGGSDLFEVCYLLNAVIPRLPNVKVVFINIHPLAFSYDNGVDESLHNVRQLYYATAPTVRSWHVIHGDFKNLIRGKISFLARDDHWLPVVYSLYKNCFALIRGEKTDFRPRYQIDEDGFIGKRRDAPMHPEARRKILGGVFKVKRYMKDQKIGRDAYKTLASTITMMRKRNIRVILYSSPLAEIGNEQFKRKEEYLLAKKYSRQLRDRYGIEYYDFSQDESFIHRYEYFVDEGHLTTPGAAAFSRKFAAALNLTSKN